MPYSLNHSWLGHIEAGECKRAIIVHSERDVRRWTHLSLFLFPPTPFYSCASSFALLFFIVPRVPLSPPFCFHTHFRDAARPSKNSALSSSAARRTSNQRPRRCPPTSQLSIRPSLIAATGRSLSSFLPPLVYTRFQPALDRG